MSGERTEKATPRQRQKAQERGDRINSRELTSSCSMLAGAVALGVIAPRLTLAWSSEMAAMLRVAAPFSWNDDMAMQQMLTLRHIVVVSFVPLLMLCGAVASAALLAAMAQCGGVQVRAQSLQLKLSRLNPATNIKQIFSLQGCARLLKSMMPVALLALAVLYKIKNQISLPVMSVEHLPRMFSSAYDLLLNAAWIFLGWSAIDYLVQWRSRESRLRMSKQEVREEVKETEGSPHIRSRIRSLQRQMRRRKLKADVQRATVVITNPTHYAVALSFDFETMDPPKVLAKGRNLLAEQIKSEARWAGIPVVENPPLARSLFRSVEEGQSIPVNLYAAVAAILAYLYRKQVEEKVQRQRENERRAAARGQREFPARKETT